MSRPKSKPGVEKSKRKSPPKWAPWLLWAMSVLKPPERMTVSEWADRHRELDDKTSNQPGRWKTSTTPYLRGIMDAFNDPRWEEIWVAKPTQSGGTESIYNMWGYTVCQDPGPGLIVYPNLDMAKAISKTRVQPMVDLCPALKARYQIAESEDLELHFSGADVRLTGAQTASGLAAFPIRYLFFDEVDKYPPAAGKEADPIKLGIERTGTFSTNRKIVGVSTPTYTRGNIWRAISNAGELWHYFVPCPHCGHYQVFTFKQVKWPDGISAEDARDLAWYECESCHEMITDLHKAEMVRLGEWRAVRSNSAARSLGIHFSAFVSPWKRFGDFAYEFLRSKDYPELLKNFINSWLAEPWEEKASKLSADIVMERQSEYEEGIVPDWAVLLTGGVDVQADYFYWTVRAWGPLLTSQNIAHGIALSWDQVEKIMNTEWRKQSGEPMCVSLAGIDSGDQTDDVYDFCAVNQEWAVPMKGASRPMLARYKVSIIDRVNSKAYGMRLVIVDGGAYKDMIAGRLKRPNGKGSWMVYRGCDADYADQVTAEEKVPDERSRDRSVMVWKPKSSHAANHYLDSEVYAAAAADLLHVRYMSEEEPSRQADPSAGKPEGSPGGFIPSGESWLKGGKWL